MKIVGWYVLGCLYAGGSFRPLGFIHRSLIQKFASPISILTYVVLEVLRKRFCEKYKIYRKSSDFYTIPAQSDE